MFHIGDKILHPMHGAGVIDDVVEQKINGECKSYYTMKASDSGMLVMIPVDRCEDVGVRYIHSPEQIEAFLAAIPELETEFVQNWNRRYRENMVKIKSGDMLEVARVVKEIMRRDAVKGLSTGERHMLQSAKRILITEIVMSEGESYADAESRLNEIMLK